MKAVTVLGALPAAPSPALSAIDIEVVPIDLVTEWRRCGMIADCMSDYMVYGFGRRDAARSVLSTVLNELVENAAKHSVDKRVAAHLSIRQYPDVVHAEVRNQTTDRHVQDLRELLSELAEGDATEVFRRRLEGRRGLGLAMIARDYGATVGAAVEPAETAGRAAVCLRVALNAVEVEQR